MTQIKKKYFTFFLMLVFCATSVFLGYEHIKFKKKNNSLIKQSEKLNKKIRLVKKKYLEKKAMADGLLRTKQALEVKQQNVAMKLEKVLKNTMLADALIIRLKKELDSVKSDLTIAETGSAEFSEKLRALKIKHAELVKTAETLTAENRELANKNLALQDEINDANQLIKQCASNNESLGRIAEELIGKYKDKKLFDVILQKEPVTQIKRVELERLDQEYRDKIKKEEFK